MQLKLCRILLMTDSDDSSDSENFEEVPVKDGYEEHVPRNLLDDIYFNPSAINYSDWHVKDHMNDTEDPTTFAASVVKQFRHKKTATCSK